MQVAKREALFNRGADAVAVHFPSRPRCYICPLCRRGFLPRALDLRKLTLEHVPPRSLKGKEIVLTCDECNSRAGHSIDAAVIEQEVTLDFIAGTMAGYYPGWLKLDGHLVQVDLRAAGKNMDVRLPKALKDSDPRVQGVRATLGRYITEGDWSEAEISLTPGRGFHRRLAQVAWLKSAYLAAFAALGYRYILNRSLRLVHEQLAQPEARILECFSVTVPADKNVRLMLMIKAPLELQSLLVQIGRHIVFLPSPLAAHDIYGFLATESRLGRSFQLTINDALNVPWPTWLDLRGDLPPPNLWPATQLD